MKTLLLISSLLFLSGCVSTGQALGSSDAIWYGKQTSILGISINTPYYCQAEKTAKGVPVPKCYEAELSNLQLK